MTLRYEYLDLSQYSIEGNIENGIYSNFYKIKKKSSPKVYLAEISRCEIPKDAEDDTHFYEKEIKLMASLIHQSFLKFIGFNCKDFKSLKRPTIVMGYSGQHTLKYFLTVVKANYSTNGMILKN